MSSLAPFMTTRITVQRQIATGLVSASGVPQAALEIVGSVMCQMQTVRHEYLPGAQGVTVVTVKRFITDLVDENGDAVNVLQNDVLTDPAGINYLCTGIDPYYEFIPHLEIEGKQGVI